MKWKDKSKMRDDKIGKINIIKSKEDAKNINRDNIVTVSNTYQNSKSIVIKDTNKLKLNQRITESRSATNTYSIGE